MSAPTLPGEPAFPVAQTGHTGLTTRELFAAMALQGLVANPRLYFDKDRGVPRLVGDAVLLADALIAALNGATNLKEYQ